MKLTCSEVNRSSVIDAISPFMEEIKPSLDCFEEPSIALESGVIYLSFDYKLSQLHVPIVQKIHEASKRRENGECVVRTKDGKFIVMVCFNL